MSALAILGHLASNASAELVARVRVAARVLWWGGDPPPPPNTSSSASPGASSVAPPPDGFRTSSPAEGSSEPGNSFAARAASIRARIGDAEAERRMLAALEGPAWNDVEPLTDLQAADLEEFGARG